MFNNPTYAFNPTLTPQQRLAQLEAMYPQYAQQPMQQMPQPQPSVNQNNSIINVASLQEAQNAQIPMTGAVSYFAFGDSILARNWSFASGKIENTLYKKVVDDTPQDPTPEKEDRLKIIEEKLDTLITQSKYPINKNKGVTKDAE